MNTTTTRIFVEKKQGFRSEAEGLRDEFNENLSLRLKELRLFNVYDLKGFSPRLLEKCKYRVFGEIVTDTVSEEVSLEGRKYLAVEYIPGQFDQRAASAVDCVHLLEPDADVEIRSSRLLLFDDDLSEGELELIRHYYINAVESRIKDLSRVSFSDRAETRPMEDLSSFCSLEESQYAAFCAGHGLAMSADDLGEVVKYFKKEGRAPSETELRILDTYWSDHCRHTTFSTSIDEISIDESFFSPTLKKELSRFKQIRSELGREGKKLCLMELATIGARYLRSKGKLDDLEQSEENNACSIYINVDIDGRQQRWLLQFKNETHNHPTEIEPFGGAATCLGGAIRDPLSGRAYVYQAMRVTGAGDILAPVGDTIPGKLPQRLISRKAAAGYSSYGNQIGLAATHVREIYHPGYTAKRMEVGAVAAAVKAENVRRESPAPGDVILLLGGRTGRDGIGGATGSSKEHTEQSLESCGSEVQKGNAPEERKLQRLFRRSEVTRLIKKCNDFGAGGVSVAIGELAPGLDIHLDRVPVKYSGLNSTELAISESQERMAVVVAASDKQEFEKYCHSENLEVTHVADVTDSGRMRMWNGDKLVADIDRAFIDSAGAEHHCRARIEAVKDENPFVRTPEGGSLKEKMISVMASPNVASQKGMIEMFDSSIGRSTVLMPFGGYTQNTETQVGVQKIPTDSYTDTASMMAFGFNPELSTWSPCHGAAYAIVEACAKVVAAGGRWDTMRFSYQEYFEKMTSESSWGKPLSALLGALRMQVELGLPSIGGKDSMSGSFESLNVPPTLIAFGITPVKASQVISPEFKWAGNYIYLIKHTPLADRMPDSEALKSNWDFIKQKINDSSIVSAWSVGAGGVAEGLVKMCFGNEFGVDVKIDENELFALNYGSVIVESERELDYPAAILLGKVTEAEDDCLRINSQKITLTSLLQAWQGRYASIYPLEKSVPSPSVTASAGGGKTAKVDIGGRKPLVFIPVFPGTNCDYDTAKAFRKAGAEVRFGVFRNRNAADILDSTDEFCENLRQCQILALCGGFSAGDEPDGSGKFIANVLAGDRIKEQVHALLDRGGLILGICNGFQALIKSGLLPYGRIGTLSEDSPTLFRNDIGRHISRMVTTRVVSTASPWMAGMKPGDEYTIPISHGEGRFTASVEMARELFERGQVAFQYVENPNGSVLGIEGLLSPDGQILGKMGHSERYETHLFKNIAEELEQPIFDNAVKHFI